MTVSRAELERAQTIVYATMPPTPQYAWPLLCEATGCETWLKHENHTPIGAFKVRGGLVHMRLRRERGATNGVITATRGNHGQSIPYAARREGIAATVVVPHGNSPEKNAAIRALGVELIETGEDFDAAKAADVVGLYLAPPEDAIVVCVDEKPSIQALERAQGYLKLPNGRALTGFAARPMVGPGGQAGSDIDRVMAENYAEEGLLGLAFAPNYAESGHFYVYYTTNQGNNRRGGVAAH